MDARTDLVSYLASRHAELRRRAMSLKFDLAYLENEMRDLETAANAIGVDLDEADDECKPVEGHANIRVPEFHLKTSGSTKTMKEVAVEILEQAKGGLTANVILKVMHHDHGMTYPRSSLSPQLSRLKYDGIVGRHDGRWVLSKYLPAKAGDENETPQGISETEKPAFPRRPLL